LWTAKLLAVTSRFFYQDLPTTEGAGAHHRLVIDHIFTFWIAIAGKKGFAMTGKTGNQMSLMAGGARDLGAWSLFDLLRLGVQTKRVLATADKQTIAPLPDDQLLTTGRTDGTLQAFFYIRMDLSNGADILTLGI
jgi:hypothetical protein